MVLSLRRSLQWPGIRDIVRPETYGKSCRGWWRKEEIKRSKEKLKATSEEKETVKDQEVTTREVVSNDAEASEEVFEEDLETDELNPRTRLRVRSRRLVLSVGESSV